MTALLLNWPRQIIRHLPRGKTRMARQWARVSPRPTVLAMTGALSGCRMSLDLSDEFQAYMACEAYAPEMIGRLRQLIRPGDTILTGGTHVGYMLLHLATFARDGQVIGFEADPRNVKACQANIALNPHLHCTMIPYGLSNAEASLPFWESNIRAHSSFATHHHATHQIQVPVRQGDGALAEIGVERIDGLLLDVEGWECKVLQGLWRTLSVHPPRWAVIECAEWALEAAGNSGDELRAMLCSLGLDIIAESNLDLICLRSA